VSKKPLIVTAVFVAAVLAGISYVTARYVDHAEIARAQQEAQSLRDERESLLAQVAAKTKEQERLTAQVGEREAQITTLRTQVAQMEEQRKTAQWNIRSLTAEEEQQRLMVAAYPEVAGAMRVADVHDDKNDIDIRYFMVPFAFAGLFLEEHQNAASYKGQTEKLRTVDGLQEQVKTLNAQVLQLEREKAEAYKTGYDSAFAKYEDINERYIALLQQPPKVEFKVPRWQTFALCTVAGVALGAQIP
jgi:septal ring factor EnvC (AmiA/AmiB activator)